MSWTPFKLWAQWVPWVPWVLRGPRGAMGAPGAASAYTDAVGAVGAVGAVCARAHTRSAQKCILMLAAATLTDKVRGDGLALVIAVMDYIVMAYIVLALYSY